MIRVKYKTAECFAPATVANVGCGFDILGFAINGLGDRVKVDLREDSLVRIKKIYHNDKLSYDVYKNTAGLPIVKFLEFIEADFGVDITIFKHMPIGSGLGSSASSSVAAVCAINSLLEEPLKKEEILQFAIDGETIASGSKHGDNVIPSLFGGFILIHEPQKFHFTRIPVPKDLFSVVIHPEIEVNTSFARSILPKSLPLHDVIIQNAAIGKLIVGLLTENFELIKGAFIDRIAEPVRSDLIPFYKEIGSILTKHGSLGFNISGSGPSVFSFFRGEKINSKMECEIQELLSEKNIKVTIYKSFINQKGAEIISRNEIL